MLHFRAKVVGEDSEGLWEGVVVGEGVVMVGAMVVEDVVVMVGEVVVCDWRMIGSIACDWWLDVIGGW